MNDFDGLLERLGAADPTEWEREYARIPLEIDQDQAEALVSSRRAYSAWFAFRFNAGPPGEPLPSVKEAFERVADGVEASPLDAYCVVFAKRVLSPDAPGEVALALICNAAASAMKQGTSWFAMWLAARAGVAAIALGEPERAWRLLDGLTRDGKRHTQLEQLAMFEPLRRSELAQNSSWVRAAIGFIWPSLGVTGIPSLPFAEPVASDGSLEETLRELERIGATRIRGLVADYASTRERSQMAKYETDPLVKELRGRVIRGQLDPPNVESAPDWFAEWAISVIRAGGLNLARLAGLVLATVDASRKREAATLVLFAARAEDLNILAAGFEEPAMAKLFGELRPVLALLPTEAADALIAFALPNHSRHSESAEILAGYIDLLQSLAVVGGGVVEHFIQVIQAIVDGRQRDHESVTFVADKLKANVSLAADRLRNIETGISETRLVNATTSIEHLEITLGLLEVTTESAWRLPSLNQLLLALVLQDGIRGTEHETLWSWSLAKLASDAIGDLRESNLSKLQLRLLDEAVERSERSHYRAHLAETYYYRAVVLLSTMSVSHNAEKRAIMDLRLAVRIAGDEGDTNLWAAATALWARALVSSDAVSAHSTQLADAERAIDEALKVPLAPIARAKLHEARAHLLGMRSRTEAISELEKAMGILAPVEPLWAKIAANIVAMLQLDERIEEAIRRGYQFLEMVPSDRTGIELAVLHLAHGSSLVQNERYDDARRQFVNTLNLSRGSDVGLAHQARISLAHLELITDDLPEAAKRIRFLQEHRHELNPEGEADLLKLEGFSAAIEDGTCRRRLVWNHLLLSRFVRGEKLSGVREDPRAKRMFDFGARHEWRSARDTGYVALRMMESTGFSLSQNQLNEFALDARKSLRRAVDAARILGSGEELLDAAFGLGKLATFAPSLEAMVKEAEYAWAIVREASAYLLLDSNSREREARLASELAIRIAAMSAGQSIEREETGLAFELGGDEAKLVERWFIRAQQPAKRPIRARLERPSRVSVARWDEWLAALESQNQRRIADELKGILDDVPSFLGEEAANKKTWAWLKTRPGSVAVGFVLAEPVSLALLMQLTVDGTRKVSVLGLNLSRPPVDVDELSEQMRGSVPGVDAAELNDALASWIRTGLVEHVVAAIGKAPNAVLWNPDPRLRVIAPGAIWGDVPVAMTASLALPNLSRTSGRRSSTFIALADPGPNEAEPQLDLCGGGVPVVKELAKAALERGPVRLMGSVGDESGRRLLGEEDIVCDAPASARDILAEAQEHEVIVLVAHGEVRTLEEAALLCVDGQGQIDRLDVNRLAKSPDSFAGAIVILLSCEGGRTGDSLADPGGLAGTLISAGARCVVAPLWPVRLDVARQVGEALLRGIAANEEPSEVLARLQVNSRTDAPTLGGPPASLADQEAVNALQRLAFVTWVG